MANKDYYEILGVSKDAPKDEVKSAFRKKARELHPDVNKAPDAEERFKELGQAYEVLMDDEKRSLYDRYGADGLKNAGYDFNGPFDFGFGDLSEILSSFFGGGFGAGRQDPNAPRRGSDLRLDFQIEFEEAVFGIERDIEINHMETCDRCSGKGMEPGTNPVTCPTCRGSGQVQQTTQTILGHFTQVGTCPRCKGTGRMISNPCNKCRGEGRVGVSKIINIKIPPGVDNGTKLRVSGEGDSGKNGGSAGDLYVVLFVKPHKVFKRDGVNIYLEKEITFSQAALGDTIDVDTVDGKRQIKIQPGIQTATVLSIKGAGVPYLNIPSRRGDQFIKLNIVTPTHLNEEEKKLFRHLAEIEKQKSQKESLLDKVKGAFTS
ncbi:MAG: molecular chaperone DnaJ [Candidatus Melainabacteria bacterium GWF2_37_15]|nr:MAG: molecular chaperone DnaJ [Candidatus Melainabacteria bacterium GWF2_37_15]